MADFVNPQTLALRPSENAMPSPWVVCTREQLTTWELIPQIYRKWVTDHIEEMTVGEKAAAVAAALEAQRDATIATVDNVEDVLRATILVLRDELNAHADKINAILDAVDGASNLATLKSAVALIANYPQRSIDNVRTTIRGKLGT